MKQASRRRVLNRLATARGHLAGVQQMAAADASCPQLIYQVRAVQGALAQIEKILIREHLRHCLGQLDLSQEDDVLGEIMQLWDYAPGDKHVKRASQGRLGRSEQPQRLDAPQAHQRRYDSQEIRPP